MMLLGPIIKNTPVIGSAISFAKTAKDTCACSTPSGAVFTAYKGIVLNCTPPVIKYSALCAALGVTSVACYCTGGNPLVASAAFQIGEAIVEEIYK